MSLFLVIFALIGAVSGWNAWRKSPLYSTKATFELLGVLVAIPAAIFATVYALSQGVFSQSPVAQGVVIGILLVTVATGGTAFIVWVTDRHVARLPPSVRVVTVQRHRVQKWIWRAVLFVLVCGAIALAFPSWSWLPGVPGSLVLLGSGPALVALYMRARRLDLGMSAVVAQPWAHWQYSPEQWQQWASQQLAWDRAKVKPVEWRRNWFKFTKAYLFLVGLFALGSIFADASVKEKIVITAGLSAFMLIVMLSISPVDERGIQRRYRRLLAAPPETYFGDEGLFCNGEFVPWTLSGDYLIEALRRPDLPARLAMIFQKFDGRNMTQLPRLVPIPDGHDADIALLQEKLRARCPKANIHMA